MKNFDLISKTKRVIKMADQNAVNFYYLSDVTWNLSKFFDHIGNEKMSKCIRTNFARYRNDKSYSKRMVPVLERAYSNLLRVSVI